MQIAEQAQLHMCDVCMYTVKALKIIQGFPHTWATQARTLLVSCPNYLECSVHDKDEKEDVEKNEG